MSKLSRSRQPLIIKTVTRDSRGRELQRKTVFRGDGSQTETELEETRRQVEENLREALVRERDAVYPPTDRERE